MPLPIIAPIHIIVPMNIYKRNKFKESRKKKLLKIKNKRTKRKRERDQREEKEKERKIEKIKTVQGIVNIRQSKTPESKKTIDGTVNIIKQSKTPESKKTIQGTINIISQTPEKRSKTIKDYIVDENDFKIKNKNDFKNLVYFFNFIMHYDIKYLESLMDYDDDAEKEYIAYLFTNFLKELKKDKTRELSYTIQQIYTIKIILNNPYTWKDFFNNNNCMDVIKNIQYGFLEFYCNQIINILGYRIDVSEIIARIKLRFRILCEISNIDFKNYYNENISQISRIGGNSYTRKNKK
jgi:hypothetical protein